MLCVDNYGTSHLDAFPVQQEAGLLLWYHSQRGEDGAAEVLASGVVTTCLDVLSNSTTLPADKSTAAGVSVALDADTRSAHDFQAVSGVPYTVDPLGPARSGSVTVPPIQ